MPIELVSRLRGSGTFGAAVNAASLAVDASGAGLESLLVAWLSPPGPPVREAGVRGGKAVYAQGSSAHSWLVGASATSAVCGVKRCQAVQPRVA